MSKLQPVASTFALCACALLSLPSHAEDARIRIHGSNTIGEALMPALIERYLDQKGALDREWVVGAPDERVLRLRSPSASLPREYEVFAHGSGTAFTDLAAGKTDIGMSSRRIKDTEIASLASLGNMISTGAENVLALDGVAVFVNKNNPVGSLTIEQIAKIFSGEAASWAAFGGPDRPIKLFVRGPGSGTRDTFEALVMGTRKIAPTAVALEDSAKLSDSVAADKDAIGFSGLAYIRAAKAVAIDECGLKYPPLDFHIKTEEYPLSRRLFLYAPPAKPLGAGREMIDFWLSKLGQSAVESNGFINLNASVETAEQQAERLRIKAGFTDTPDDAFRKFFPLASATKRLSFTFRFETNSDVLDTRAERDLLRLVDFMKAPENAGRAVSIVGFTDSRGSRPHNTELSAKRADAVRKKLVDKGVSPARVEGFGPDFPVACNTTDPGREKNRRVEVWVQ